MRSGDGVVDGDGDGKGESPSVMTATPKKSKRAQGNFFIKDVQRGGERCKRVVCSGRRHH